MAVKVRKFTVDSRAGDVIVVLQSLNALPINGVMATLDQRTISPEHQTDPSVATFRLPAETGRYLVYGVITPLKRLWRKPFYLRAVLQDGVTIRTRGRNPMRMKARKLNSGEWAGTPEVISIKAK
jgi:hypothetical protein